MSDIWMLTVFIILDADCIDHIGLVLSKQNCFLLPTLSSKGNDENSKLRSKGYVGSKGSK